jgi:hypothetical protein
MNFLKRNIQRPNAAGDELARTIADRIIRSQQLIAAKMNRYFNGFSKQRQKWLLLIFCGSSAAWLICCLLVPNHKMAMKMPGNAYQTVHIGMPSEIPPKPAQSKTNDPLTNKK